MSGEVHLLAPLPLGALAAAFAECGLPEAVAQLELATGDRMPLPFKG